MLDKMASFREAFSGKTFVCGTLTTLHSTYITVGQSVASLSYFKYYIYDTVFAQKSIASSLQSKGKLPFLNLCMGSWMLRYRFQRAMCVCNGVTYENHENITGHWLPSLGYT